MVPVVYCYEELGVISGTSLGLNVNSVCELIPDQTIPDYTMTWKFGLINNFNIT